MDFRTELTPKSSSFKIELTDPVVTMGSCFSDEVGQKFREHKFTVCVNPLGTVYNPVSIHKILVQAIRNENPSHAGYIDRDGIFYHYDFHSDWFGKSKEDLEDKLKRRIAEVKEEMARCKFLILTYGTCWVYEERELKTVVANCHRIPQKNFDKFLLTQKKMLESFNQLYQELKSGNPECKIILTVSPVRHIKDTLELNSVSKSILRLTCHTLSDTYADVEYFPSYEIMMDDLRDYRFYKPDLIHPSGQAIDYIWEKFIDACLSSGAKGFIEDWKEIISAIGHRSFHPESKAHQQFLKDTLAQLYGLKQQVNVEEEIEFLENQLQPSN